MAFRRATIQEFWREVKEGTVPIAGWLPCWNYTGSDAYSGYKAFRCVLAHRAAATIYTGRIPGKVKQMCGNRCCVRLEHLRIGEKGNRERVSAFTGRALCTPTVKMPGTIQAVLDARPETGKYKVSDIASAAHTTHDNVRKILREAALYDLASEVRELIESKRPIQTKPE